jgi:hypothetical protein
MEDVIFGEFWTSSKFQFQPDPEMEAPRVTRSQAIVHHAHRVATELEEYIGAPRAVTQATELEELILQVE